MHDLKVEDTFEDILTHAHDFKTSIRIAKSYATKIDEHIGTSSSGLTKK